MPGLFFLNRETKETRKETRDGSLSTHLGERRQRTVPCLLSPLVSLSPFLCRLADRRVRIPIVFLNLCDHIYTGLEETSANRSQPSSTNKHTPPYFIPPYKECARKSRCFPWHTLFVCTLSVCILFGHAEAQKRAVKDPPENSHMRDTSFCGHRISIRQKITALIDDKHPVII